VQFLLNLPFLLAGYFIKFLFFCRKRMGILYLKGIGDGFKKSFSPEGRKKKVRFCVRNLGAYVGIQLELYVNLVRWFVGR